MRNPRRARKAAGGAAGGKRAAELAALARKTLLPLIKDDLQVLEVLDRHGVHFCAGCYMTLSAPVERVAAYHAVHDRERFLKDLKEALDGRERRV